MRLRRHVDDAPVQCLDPRAEVGLDPVVGELHAALGDEAIGRCGQVVTFIEDEQAEAG